MATAIQNYNAAIFNLVQSGAITGAQGIAFMGGTQTVAPMDTPSATLQYETDLNAALRGQPFPYPANPTTPAFGGGTTMYTPDIPFYGSLGSSPVDTPFNFYDPNATFTE